MGVDDLDLYAAFNSRRCHRIGSLGFTPDGTSYPKPRIFVHVGGLFGRFICRRHDDRLLFDE